MGPRCLKESKRFWLATGYMSYEFCAGFKGVEIGWSVFGYDVPPAFTIQQILEAKEAAKVEVVGLCAPRGMHLTCKGVWAN